MDLSSSNHPSKVKPSSLPSSSSATTTHPSGSQMDSTNFIKNMLPKIIKTSPSPPSSIGPAPINVSVASQLNPTPDLKSPTLMNVDPLESFSRPQASSGSLLSPLHLRSGLPSRDATPLTETSSLPSPLWESPGPRTPTVGISVSPAVEYSYLTSNDSPSRSSWSGRESPISPYISTGFGSFDATSDDIETRTFRHWNAIDDPFEMGITPRTRNPRNLRARKNASVRSSVAKSRYEEVEFVQGSSSDNYAPEPESPNLPFTSDDRRRHMEENNTSLYGGGWMVFDDPPSAAACESALFQNLERLADDPDLHSSNTTMDFDNSLHPVAEEPEDEPTHRTNGEDALEDGEIPGDEVERPMKGLPRRRNGYVVPTVNFSMTDKGEKKQKPKEDHEMDFLQEALAEDDDEDDEDEDYEDDDDDDDDDNDDESDDGEDDEGDDDEGDDDNGEEDSATPQQQEECAELDESELQVDAEDSMDAEVPKEARQIKSLPKRRFGYVTPAMLSTSTNQKEDSGKMNEDKEISSVQTTLAGEEAKGTPFSTLIPPQPQSPGALEEPTENVPPSLPHAAEIDVDESNHTPSDNFNVLPTQSRQEGGFADTEPSDTPTTNDEASMSLALGAEPPLLGAGFGSSSKSTPRWNHRPYKTQSPRLRKVRETRANNESTVQPKEMVVVQMDLPSTADMNTEDIYGGVGETPTSATIPPIPFAEIVMASDVTREIPVVDSGEPKVQESSAEDMGVGAKHETLLGSGEASAAMQEAGTETMVSEAMPKMQEVESGGSPATTHASATEAMNSDVMLPTRGLQSEGYSPGTQGSSTEEERESMQSMQMIGSASISGSEQSITVQDMSAGGTTSRVTTATRLEELSKPEAVQRSHVPTMTPTAMEFITPEETFNTHRRSPGQPAAANQATIDQLIEAMGRVSLSSAPTSTISDLLVETSMFGPRMPAVSSSPSFATPHSSDRTLSVPAFPARKDASSLVHPLVDEDVSMDAPLPPHTGSGIEDVDMSGSPLGRQRWLPLMPGGWPNLNLPTAQSRPSNEPPQTSQLNTGAANFTTTGPGTPLMAAPVSLTTPQEVPCQMQPSVSEISREHARSGLSMQSLSRTVHDAYGNVQHIAAAAVDITSPFLSIEPHTHRNNWHSVDDEPSLLQLIQDASIEIPCYRHRRRASLDCWHAAPQERTMPPSFFAVYAEQSQTPATDEPEPQPPLIEADRRHRSRQALPLVFFDELQKSFHAQSVHIPRRQRRALPLSKRRGAPTRACFPMDEQPISQWAPWVPFTQPFRDICGGFLSAFPKFW